MLDPVPISRTGFNKLKEKLDRLEKELTQVRKDVAAARELGDLKENGAYIYGRERQGFLEGQIGELKGKINRSDIVDCTQVECDEAAFGTVVTLLDLDMQEKVTYQLLGPDDADYDTGSISIHSPVGSVILGSSIGDRVSVSIPRGDRNFEVLHIGKSEFD
ncbi:MAG: transcription elongation factor GreA [Sedimentisphaerales bacterium]|nr:transcription elongation factor GreA [Sedimentisphaerales bacterium]